MVKSVAMYGFGRGMCSHSGHGTALVDGATTERLVQQAKGREMSVNK